MRVRVIAILCLLVSNGFAGVGNKILGTFNDLGMKSNFTDAVV